MSKINNILSLVDVASALNLSANALVCNLLEVNTLVINIIKKCFGKAFYKALVSDLHDYSLVQAYQIGVTYGIGDKVIYNGVVMEAVAETNKRPDVYTDWQPAPKFKTSCFNDLWCNGFLIYLSYEVMALQSPNMYISNTNGYFVKRTGEGFVNIDRRDFELMQENYKQLSTLALENVIEYIKEAYAEGAACLGLFKDISSGCCKTCTDTLDSCECETSCFENKKSVFYSRFG